METSYLQYECAVSSSGEWKICLEKKSKIKHNKSLNTKLHEMQWNSCNYEYYYNYSCIFALEIITQPKIIIGILRFGSIQKHPQHALIRAQPKMMVNDVLDALMHSIL